MAGISTSTCGETSSQDVPIKKRRVEDIDTIFTDFPESLKRQIAVKLHDLCDFHGPAFNSLRFSNCNAADANGGITFSKAYCSVKPGKSKFFFGTIFIDGMTMISKFLQQGTVPESKPERFVLSKLLHFIVDAETQVALLKLEHYGETDRAIVLANHLFGKLATSRKYVIDKHCTEKKLNKCPCDPDCEMSGTFGDTSIGNEEVWHGQLDIIVNQDIGVNTTLEDDDTESPEGKSPVELKCTSLERSPEIIAQTVVFSFLQKQNHPLSKHFLFPCFRVSNTSLVIYFYDSEHDVLLESAPVPLLVKVMNDSSMKVNLTAILVSWFTVNYKILSSGLPESLKSENKKADFFPQAKEKLEVYRSKLKSGNVGESVHPVADNEHSYEVSPAALDEARRDLYEVVWRGMEEKDCDARDK